MVLRGEGKELKEDLKEVVLKDQEISNTVMKVPSLYTYTHIYTVRHHAALFTLEIITTEL